MLTLSPLRLISSDLPTLCLSAYQTAVLTHKVIQSGKPVHISNKIKPRQTNLSLRHGGGVLSLPQYKLSLSREGFLYRGSYIHNMLDENIRVENNISMFKRNTKEWIRKHIPIKPKQIFSKIVGSQTHKANPQIEVQATTQASIQPPVNTITRYFKPIKNA